MRRHPVRFVVATFFVTALAAVVHDATAREVTFGPDCVPVLTALEHKLLDVAETDTGALRRYLFARRAIYDLPIYETAVWAERVGQQRNACLRALALTDARTVDARAAQAPR